MLPCKLELIMPVDNLPDNRLVVLNNGDIILVCENEDAADIWSHFVDYIKFTSYGNFLNALILNCKKG